jgi:hypothetical protein
VLFATLGQLAARADEVPGGAALLDKVRSTLRQDEHVAPCLAVLNEAGVEAQRLLSNQAVPKIPLVAKVAGEVVLERRFDIQNTAAARTALQELIAELDKASASGDGELGLSGNLSLIRRKGH